MKVCRCGPKFAFDEAHIEISADLGPVWVHEKCNGVSHAFQSQGAGVTRGPANARGFTSYVGHADGRAMLTWVLEDGSRTMTVEYRTYPRVIEMSEREPLIFKTWELLMSKVVIILREPDGPGDNVIEAEARERAKYEARGIAEVLAILMKPFMDPPEGSTKSAADMVVNHAVKAYKNPNHEVPGLGLHLWDPNRNADGSPRTVIAEPKRKPAAGPRKTSAAPRRAVPKSSATKLKPEEIEPIKEAFGSGMFSKEDLASMFKVTMETLEEALAS